MLTAGSSIGWSGLKLGVDSSIPLAKGGNKDVISKSESSKGACLKIEICFHK